jgi:hypothetical protein
VRRIGKDRNMETRRQLQSGQIDFFGVAARQQ